MKFITTPIYYTNGKPHLGHVYTTLAADVLRRAYEVMAQPVHVRTGVDEHGLKVQRKAESLGIDPQALCDQVASDFLYLFRDYGVDTRDFYRTSSPQHKALALEVFESLRKAGHVYEGTYSGWYAQTDEAYYDEAETVLEGDIRRSVLTGSPVEWLETPCYFFRLSSFRDKLLEWYQTCPDVIMPEGRRNEIVSFVKSGLKDLSITRRGFTWGIPVTREDVLYVWIDALSNYLAKDRFGREVWPAAVQLVGKDILRFHAVIWPAMLMALGKPLPERIFAHGWWLTESGDKMAKSAGNVIDPRDLLEAYGDPGVLTYYMFREVPFGEDGKFSTDRVEVRYKELQNKYGNLVNRVVSMINKYNIPVSLLVLAETPEQITEVVRPYYEVLAFHKVLEHVVDQLDEANRSLQNSKPWDKGHTPGSRELVLTKALIDIYDVSVLLSPYLPRQTTTVMQALSRSAHLGVPLDIPLLFPPL